MANQTIIILLHVDLIDPELGFDQYDDDFHKIVCDADEYIQKTSATRPTLKQPPSSLPSRTSSAQSFAAVGTRRLASESPPARPLLPRPETVPAPMFSLPLGCVTSLHLSASRCRNPRIRYRALDLLRRCNRREGLWDSNVASRIAEKVIAIEEAKTTQTVDEIRQSPSAHSMHVLSRGEVVIPERHRVKYIDLKFGPEGHGKAMYSFENPTRAIATLEAMPSTMDTRGLGQLYEW